MGKIIEVKNLFKLYRVGDSVVHALNGVNFSNQRRRVLCDCRNFGIGEINVVKYACRIGKTDKRRSDHQRRAHGEAEGRSACQL